MNAGDKVTSGKTEWTVYVGGEKMACVYRQKGKKFVGGIYYAHSQSVQVMGESDTPPSSDGF